MVLLCPAWQCYSLNIWLYDSPETVISKIPNVALSSVFCLYSYMFLRALFASIGHLFTQLHQKQTYYYL